MSDDDVSIAQRFLAIAETALQQTRAGALTWAPMDDEDSFIFSGSKSSIIIDWHPSEERYELRLLNPRGTVVETYSKEDPKNRDPWATPDPAIKDKNTKAFRALRDLHDAARRSALDIDNLLDAALADIKSPPSDEPPF